MAQFDVHISPGRNRAAVPYVVILQSRYFDQLATRVVIPLMTARTSVTTERLTLTPSFTVRGKLVYLNPLEMQTVPRSALGKRVASLADDDASGQIINAIDAMITRAYG
jgi:toxin CcdB